MGARLNVLLHELTAKDRFIFRDFVFSEDQIEKQREELAAADTTEKELWVGSYMPPPHLVLTRQMP